MSISWLAQPYGNVLHTPPYGIRQIPGRNVTTESWDGVGVIAHASKDTISIKGDYFQGIIKASGPLVIYEARDTNRIRVAHIKSESGLIVVLGPHRIYTPDEQYDPTNGRVKPVKREPTTQEVKEALGVLSLFKEIEAAARIEKMLESLKVKQ